ncbi:hypothetical protein GCM10020001_083230 [Nonomuraea salmonea]
MDADDDGHGTHVASTIASPINGIGIAGVAPGVQIVNIRAGQDSGFFFLKPSLDALTYAADIGVDVVNMSYYVDPWLFNCRANKSDTKKQQLEQRAIITGMQRALDYARKRGVTLISALGNGSTDLGNPKIDKQSPGYPKGDEKERTIDNSCINVPAESKGVISVSALGPSGRKAAYSDYGVEQTDVSAPRRRRARRAGRQRHQVHPRRRAGTRAARRGPRRQGRQAQGRRRRTRLHRRPLLLLPVPRRHLHGRAARHRRRRHPHQPLRQARQGRARTRPPTPSRTCSTRPPPPKACPSPREYTYNAFGTSEKHLCQGDTDDNGFYGHGIVNAWKAATAQP